MIRSTLSVCIKLLLWASATITGTCSAQMFISFWSGQILAGGPAIVYITDQLPSALAAAPQIVIERSGNTFKVCINRVLTGTGDSVSATVQVQPASLPEGDYKVEYLESNAEMGQTQPACAVKLTTDFVVVATTYERTLIEFYNAQLDHYFMTADSYEQYVLDSGIIPGWARTSHQYAATFDPSTPSPALAPVCRFYGLPQAGINSHFFSAIRSDCQIVIDTWPNAWELETWNAFDAVPLQPDGNCPGPLVQFTRMYNNKPDANHRYLTRRIEIDAMKALGWIEEGPVWCVQGSTI